MKNENNGSVEFDEALGMVLQPDAMLEDWEYYYRAAAHLGMDRQTADDYWARYKKEIGA